MSGTPQPYTGENFAPFDRLDSWKEIAVYLKRDVRTVQRWEKTEKLPVRRHLHEKQGTIYAFKSEIDAWSHDRQPQDDDEEPADDSALNVATDTEAVRTDPERESTKPEPGPVHRLFTPVVKRSLVILAVAAAGALAAHLLWPQHPMVLAVLPFKNLGASDREAMVDGFTAETKTRLEQVQPERMGVLLLTKRYADLPVDKVAAEFNAAYVLQGDARIVARRSPLPPASSDRARAAALLSGTNSTKAICRTSSEFRVTYRRRSLGQYSTSSPAPSRPSN